ncbi:MAG: hypothetical protein HYS05_09695 [Acidobacteria bacterium]|nr:hypothetical protein [Acidobacteriota bacterium]
MIPLALVACSSRGEVQREGAAAEVWDLTGARTRVVWVQGDGTDPFAQGEALVLKGLDTDDKKGERTILGRAQNYAKPLLTPRGDRVVFSSRRELHISIVNWDGSNLRRLAPGYALAVWADPADDAEWIYAGRDFDKDRNTFGRVVRFRIDRPDQSELVWNKTPVSEDTFHVSADGRQAGGLFPWPEAGVAELPNRGWKKLGEGCWTALASPDKTLLWYFDGGHRNLTFVEIETGNRWRVPINKVAGFNGNEVYHPRWTRDPRFLTITGPYIHEGQFGNKVRGGGRQVEVYLGRFSADYSMVAAWARVTANEAGDAYPDVWVDSGRPPGQRAPRPASPRAGAGLEQSTSRSSAPTAERLVLEVRLSEAGTIPSPRSIAPYRHALVVNRYEIVSKVDGRYAAREILVAEWAIRDGRILPDARKAVGMTARLTLEPYDAHPELEGERLVMSFESNLPLYYHVK